MPCTRYTSLMICTLDSQLRWVVSLCTGTQRNETLTNCVTTPCVDMKTIGIPPCTGTPGQPPEMFRFKTLLHHCAMFRGKIPNFLSASPNCEGAVKDAGGGAEGGGNLWKPHISGGEEILSVALCYLASKTWAQPCHEDNLTICFFIMISSWLTSSDRAI